MATVFCAGLMAVIAAAQTRDIPGFDAASVKPVVGDGTAGGPPLGGPGLDDIGTLRGPCERPSRATSERVKIMLQGFLIERFQIALRRDKKEQPVYSLVVGKKGPKLKPSVEDQNARDPSYPASPPDYPVGRDGFAQPPRGKSGGINIMFGGPGRLRISAIRQSLPEFAGFLGLQLGRLVIDETGLPGKYDLMLDFTPAGDQMPKGPFGEDIPIRRGRKLARITGSIIPTVPTP